MTDELTPERSIDEIIAMCRDFPYHYETRLLTHIDAQAAGLVRLQTALTNCEGELEVAQRQWSRARREADKLRAQLAQMKAQAQS